MNDVWSDGATAWDTGGPFDDLPILAVYGVLLAFVMSVDPCLRLRERWMLRRALERTPCTAAPPECTICLGTTGADTGVRLAC